MTEPLHISDEQCRRVSGIMEVVGRRWTSGILLAVGLGAERFSEIQHRVDGLSSRMLTVRLRELEQAGLIDRIVTPTIPVSVRYRTTQRGLELLRALQPLGQYAHRWEPEPGQ